MMRSGNFFDEKCANRLNHYITYTWYNYLIFRWLKVERIIFNEISLFLILDYIQYLTNSIGLFCLNNHDKNWIFRLNIWKTQKYFCDCFMIKLTTRQQIRSRDGSNKMLAFKSLWIKMKTLNLRFFLVIGGNHASDEWNCVSPTTVLE